LAVDFILRIAGTENAREIGRCGICLGFDVAGVIHVDLAFKDVGIWFVANCDKESSSRDRLLLAGLIVFYLNACESFIIT
jgi:hypothetical protein